MLSYKKCRRYRLSRFVMALVIASGALALSGCPGSNWSNPQLATPQAPQTPQAIVTPPVTAPPVTPPPPIIPPPPVEKPPAPPTSVAAPAAPPPIATDGTLSTIMGGTKAGALVGTGKGALIYAIIVPSLSGTAKLIDPSTGAFTYAPNPQFSGTDRLQFTVTDSGGTSKPATVTITVNPSAIGALSAPANIGVNVEGVSYYNASQQYVDVMRQGDQWQSTETDTVYGRGKVLGTVGKLDANGWPTQDALIPLVSGGAPSGSAADPGPASYLSGKYQLSFNGKAAIGDAGGIVRDQKYDPVTNTTTATLDQSPQQETNGPALVYLSFTQTQRTADSPLNTGFTNMRVIRPQFAPNGAKWWDSPDQEFTNPFLASLAPFSTLRFMDWTLTNHNQQVDWNQRTPANWPTADHQFNPDGNAWRDSGPSWESAIALTNLTGKDMWINIPAHATDDYVKSLATLLKQKLKAGTHVYVEYSNEVWNYGFEQYQYNDATTKALIADNPEAAANYQKYSEPWANDASRAAERLMQISNNFASVWGAQAINETIRPVFCWQAGSVALRVAMGYIEQTYGPPAKYFYGLCSAPYFGASNITEGESVDDILTASAATIPQSNSSLNVYTTTALYYGLHNLAYEGGPGLDGSIDLANKIAANVDPRMGLLVTQSLTGAFQNGLDMFMYYQSAGPSSQYGMWGATDDIFDLTRPKWTALQALSGKTVTRTLSDIGGIRLPGTIDATKSSFGIINGVPNYTTRSSYCHPTTADSPGMCTWQGDNPQGNSQYGYLVLAPIAGSYTVTLKFDNRDSDRPASTAKFYVNQVPQGGVINITPSNSAAPGTAPSFNITLPAGSSLLELEATSGSFAVQSITITAN